MLMYGSAYLAVSLIKNLLTSPKFYFFMWGQFVI